MTHRLSSGLWVRLRGGVSWIEKLPGGRCRCEIRGVERHKLSVQVLLDRRVIGEIPSAIERSDIRRRSALLPQPSIREISAVRAA